MIIAVLNLVVIWCVSGVLIWQRHRDAVADGKSTATTISLAAAAYTQQALVAADLVLRSMLDWVADEDIRSEAQLLEATRQRRLHEAMHDRIVGVPQVIMASVFDKEGGVLNSSLAGPAPSELSRQEILQSMAGDHARLSSSRAVIDPSIGRWIFYLSRPIRSKSGGSLGVVVVGIDADYFASLFRSFSIRKDCAVSLFRLDGALLATTLPAPDLIGRTFDSAPPVRMIREGLSGTSQLISESTWWDSPTSEGRIVAVQRVQDFPFLIAVTIGEHGLLGQWRLRVYLIVTLALLISVAVALVSAWLLRLDARTEAAAQLAAERRLLAALVDTPAALCAVLDRLGQIIYCNDRFRQVVAAGGNTDNVLRAGAIRGSGPILDFAATAHPQPLETDIEVAWPDKGRRHLHFSASHQSLPDIGHCTILVGHDETLRHQTQQAIAQTAKLVTLGEMTTGMAHELSQPLNVIKMAAQNALAEVTPGEHPLPDDNAAPALRDAELRSVVAGKLNRIVRQVDRAASIIARMRIFGRAPSGPPGIFDARDACREALTWVGQRLRSGGVSVREELSDAPLGVRGHQDLLEQVLVSLLLNARDALQQSSQADKTITLSARRSGGHVLVTVADNGPGVPSEMRERIFEPFFTSKPGGQGAGLGLFLSFGIVQEAGGTLSLLSGDSGAVFQIDLPGAG